MIKRVIDEVLYLIKFLFNIKKKDDYAYKVATNVNNPICLISITVLYKYDFGWDKERDLRIN